MNFFKNSTLVFLFWSIVTIGSAHGQADSLFIIERYKVAIDYLDKFALDSLFDLNKKSCSQLTIFPSELDSINIESILSKKYPRRVTIKSMAWNPGSLNSFGRSYLVERGLEEESLSREFLSHAQAAGAYIDSLWESNAHQIVVAGDIFGVNNEWETGYLSNLSPIHGNLLVASLTFYCREGYFVSPQLVFLFEFSEDGSIIKHVYQYKKFP